MMIRFLILFLLITLNIFPQSGIRVIPEDAQLEKVFGDGFFTEGPAEAKDGSIYFSDQTFTADTDMEAGIIWKYDPKTNSTIVFRSPSGMANGNEMDKDGNLLTACGADFGLRSVIKTDLTTGKSKIIAGFYNSKAFNSPNDIALDNKGRIYFTDPRYTGHEPIDQPVNGVYRIDTNGKISLIISDIAMPNGIAISPDQKELFVGCNFEGDSLQSPKMNILQYKLNSAGETKFSKVFIDYGKEIGPDGIAFDEKGLLYVALRDEANPGIYVYDKAGKEVSRIPLPEVPSNLLFTKYSKIQYLYITAGKSLYRIKCLNKGSFNYE